MRLARIVTGLSWRWVDIAYMDVLAIVLAIVMFAILLALIEGIDRV